MANVLFTVQEIQKIVVSMELLLLGLVGLIIVYLLGQRQPQKGNRNSILYILVMGLIFYAIFYLRDPLEFVPQEVWNLANYVIIVITIYGFYRQILGGFRSEFNDRLKDSRDEIGRIISDFKTEIRRDFDRIERRLEKLEDKIEKIKRN